MDLLCTNPRSLAYRLRLTIDDLNFSQFSVRDTGGSRVYGD